MIWKSLDPNENPHDIEIKIYMYHDTCCSNILCSWSRLLSRNLARSRRVVPLYIYNIKPYIEKPGFDIDLLIMTFNGANQEERRVLYLGYDPSEKQQPSCFLSYFYQLTQRQILQEEIHRPFGHGFQPSAASSNHRPSPGN
jgi:hypothetical protein